MSFNIIKSLLLDLNSKILFRKSDLMARLFGYFELKVDCSNLSCRTLHPPLTHTRKYNVIFCVRVKIDLSIKSVALGYSRRFSFSGVRFELAVAKKY